MRKNLQILLLDDDKIEHIKFNRALKAKNHEVTIAINGREALEKLTSFVPDLIIMDLNMPDTNGIEFLTSLKQEEHLKFIPAVVMTTTVNRDELSKLYDLGIGGYFLKPLRYPDYERIINQIVDYWSENEFYGS